MATATLTTGEQNAYQLMTSILAQFGLQSLAGDALSYVKQGFTDPTDIETLLETTPAWQTRFAGNAQRIKNGMAPLDPATYLSTEASYADAIKSAGLPAGFYDGGNDFANWIGNDVSASEVQQRASDAASVVDSFDPGSMAAFTQLTGINKGGVAAYVLDQNKALPILEQQMRAAQVGGAAVNAGYNLSNDDMNRYADLGVTQSQAQNAFQTIGADLGKEQTLSAIYHQAYGLQDMENELLGGSGAAASARQALNQKEKDEFSGSGAVGSTLVSPGYGVAKTPTAQF